MWNEINCIASYFKSRTGAMPSKINADGANTNLGKTHGVT